MERRSFILQTGLAGAGLLLHPNNIFSNQAEFPVVRTPLASRKFSSEAVEKAITTFKAGVRNRELAWLFENCFPNTLDTTVDVETVNGRPDTYVITGDIDAMWLRDSSAQVWPYLAFIGEDKPLRNLVAGVINRQVSNILYDPYANAFYKDRNKTGEWKDDLTVMKPGIHERKWEIDSLCYPIRLSWHYWKKTGDTQPFDGNWKQAMALVLATFREQQRKNGHGPYKFERRTSWATDGVPIGGYGYPVAGNGLICSVFRPSDDATLFLYLIPANFFAVISLQQAAEMLRAIHHDTTLAADCEALAKEVAAALQQHAIVQHPSFGKVYAYEVNGLGSHNLMDDANVPSLLSLPYLGAITTSDPIYQNTRRLLLSRNNPFFFKGKAAEGIGGPHAGIDMIWPMSIIMRGLTSTNDDEIARCIKMLQATHANTGFIHEAFHKDDPTRFTRKWFAWANTLFGEFLWKVFTRKPQLLE